MASRRRYRLGVRGDRTQATRRRIVETTIGLHDEQGISRTTFRDVAARAGVSPSTVLRHFPRMEELIRACGALSEQLAPFPGQGVLAGARSASERLGRAIEALFAWYDLVERGMDHLQVDRRAIPEVDAWLRRVDRDHRALVALALDADPDHELIALVTASTSIGAWRSLRGAGLASAEAVKLIVRHSIGDRRSEEGP